MSAEGAIRTSVALVVMAVLVLLIVLPLYFVLSKSMQDATGHFVGWRNFVVYADDAALHRSVYNSLFVSVLTAAITVPLAFAVFLRADEKLHSAEAAVQGHRAPAAARALAASGDFADVHVRKPGLPQSLACRSQHLRADRDRHRAELPLLSARGADPDDRARPLRSAPLRGGRDARHLALADVPDDHLPVDPLRPDQRARSSSSPSRSSTSASPR